MYSSGVPNLEGVLVNSAAYSVDKTHIRQQRDSLNAMMEIKGEQEYTITKLEQALNLAQRHGRATRVIQTSTDSKLPETENKSPPRSLKRIGAASYFQFWLLLGFLIFLLSGLLFSCQTCFPK